MNDQSSGLRKGDQIQENPMELFSQWLALAEQSEPNDPSAMTLATVDRDGMPNARMVLMRRWDERGIVFFTNFESQKGEELIANPKAAASFHWKSLRKCVRFRGEIEVVSDEEAEDYFQSRARGSRRRALEDIRGVCRRGSPTARGADHGQLRRRLDLALQYAADGARGQSAGHPRALLGQLRGVGLPA